VAGENYERRTLNPSTGRELVPSTLKSTPPAQKNPDKTSGSHIGEDGTWNVSGLKEEDFEALAVYLVPDIATSPEEPNRAEASLPRNLALKPSGVLQDVRNYYYYYYSLYCISFIGQRTTACSKYTRMFGLRLLSVTYVRGDWGL
jgi:hypothetical protein